jgi:predicted transposase/invertase (TIGR01784 family)
MRIGERLIEKGIEKGIKQVAYNMLASNISVDVISKATNLSLQEIKKLQRKVH